MVAYDGGPDFPVNTSNNHEFGGAYDAHPGMSLREYAAIKAMHGLLANPSLDVAKTDFTKAAVKFADELLAELAKGKGE